MEIYINRKTVYLKQEQRERGKLIEKAQLCFHANELWSIISPIFS